jgi:hypothetical protein
MSLYRDKNGNVELSCPLEWRSESAERCEGLGKTSDADVLLDHLVAEHDPRELAIFLMRAELENDAMRDLADCFDKAGSDGEALFPAPGEAEEFAIEIARPR